MKIIRDPYGMTSLNMLALLITWNMRRCNFTGCRARPNTIISMPAEETGGAGAITYALCEDHFQQFNVPEGGTISLEFDDYDAFKEEVKDVQVC